MNGIESLLWLLAIVLAIILLVLGLVLARNSPGGKRRLGWPETIAPHLIRVVGIVMIAGALCLVAPLAAPALAWLTPAAAAVLLSLIAGIVQSYLVRRDSEGAAPYIMVIVMLLALIVGRWGALMPFS